MRQADRLSLVWPIPHWSALAGLLSCCALWHGWAAAAEYPAIGTIERLDARFDQLVLPGAVLEKLAEGFRWSEGPVWIPDGRYLLFSDIPNNAVMKWEPTKGISVFLKPAGYTGREPRGGESGSNGLALDAAGRLILCQHGDRRIARLEKDGAFTTLVDSFQGKRLNSPNDLVFKSNGDLYFTDPPYGLAKGPDDPARELDFCGVYRLSADGKLTLLTRELTRPNGIAFSPDEKTLYVANSDPKRAIWMAFPVKEDGTLGPGRVFFDATPWVSKLKGLPDGMKVDTAGNLWATGPGGVNVFSPDGTLLGRINPDQPTANCCFGDDGSTLYITANQYLCRIRTKAKGLNFADRQGAATRHHRPQLLKNPTFRPAEGQTLPEGWTLWAPLHPQAACPVAATTEGLRIEAPADFPMAVGGVYQDVSAITGGTAYAIRARCSAAELSSAYRSLMIRLLWTRGGKPVHPAGALVRGPVAQGTLLQFEDVLVAPQEADGVRFWLEVKWPGRGSVLWHEVTLQPTDPPLPRKVKLGTVHFRPRNSTPEKNLDLFCQYIDQAGQLGLDAVCLGEAITMVGTQKTLVDVAEPIPGPSTEKLGQAAARNRLWVVAGLMERDGPRVYNTAVLLDRQGKLAGKYRKVHLPREEWQKGITPGSEYPVFKTDFGTVAIQICYDWFFPEIHAILALKGAEVVFAPTWGTTFPDQEGRAEGETVFRVRARDNGFYLIPSVYDGSSMVIDPLGRILASNKGKEGVFWAEVDLNHREPLFWVGHWGAVGPRDRMPETYQPLTEPPTFTRW